MKCVFFLLDFFEISQKWLNYFDNKKKSEIMAFWSTRKPYRVNIEKNYILQDINYFVKMSVSTFPNFVNINALAQKLL